MKAANGRRADLVGRLTRGDPGLSRPLGRLRREAWHLWDVLRRVYAGTDPDPSTAVRWAADAEAGGLAGRLQQGFLHDALDRLAELEDAERGG